jgi:adenosylcobinamide kinase/adenosylcobinamide-phosphate guanylyltransferase
MGKIIFILGGARSGKSTYAIELAKKLDKKVAFIATCSPLDVEMKKRIEIHKRSRPAYWETFEEYKEVSALLKRIGSKFNVVIIDCLTLFISNLLSEGFDDNAIVGRINKVLQILKERKCKSILISNEVGLGIVPKSRLARRFRDLAGRVNQMLVQKADEVLFMISGLPLKIKGGKR